MYKLRVNLETEVPVSQSVLKNFEISTVVLQNFKTRQQKVEYLAQQMDSKV